MRKVLVSFALIWTFLASPIARAAPSPDPLIIARTGIPAIDDLLVKFRLQYLSEPIPGSNPVRFRIRANSWFDNCFARSRFLATMLEAEQNVKIIGYLQIRVNGWVQGWRYHVVPVARINGVAVAVESIEGYMTVENWVRSLNPNLGAPMNLHLVAPSGNPWDITALENQAWAPGGQGTFNGFFDGVIRPELNVTGDVEMLTEDAILQADRDLFHLEWYRRFGTYDTEIRPNAGGPTLYEIVNTTPEMGMNGLWQGYGLDTSTRGYFHNATRARPHVCGGT